MKLEDLIDHGNSNNLEILINKCITWSQEIREKGFLNIVNEPVSYTHLTLPTKA